MLIRTPPTLATGREHAWVATGNGMDLWLTDEHIVDWDDAELWAVTP